MDTAAGVLNNPEPSQFANGNKYYTVSVTLCKLFFLRTLGETFVAPGLQLRKL